MSTAASPAEPLAGPWGVLTWHPDPRTAPRGRPRSYDHLGRVLVWDPPAPGGPAAVDVESPDRPLDPALRRRWGAADDAEFLARWTVGEVLAKLTGIPMPQWLSRHGLPPAPGPGHRRLVVNGSAVDLWHLDLPTSEALVTCGSLVVAGDTLSPQPAKVPAGSIPA